MNSLALKPLSKAVAVTDAHLLHISGLPSLSELSAWQHRGISHLVNVSGVDILEIYQTYQNTLLAGFTVAQFALTDVFTSGNNLTADLLTQPASPALYLQMSTESQREILATAVQHLTRQLANAKPTCIFCHRGLGRSPLVVACAFQEYFQESSHQAIFRTLALHKSAHFTDISLSALAWCKAQTHS